jgi:ParB family transcriptional regulator, chromosome partitioning protein
MQAAHAVIGLDELDLEDDRFAVRSYLTHERLAASLAHMGILFPPWIWARGDRKFTVVDGFKRFQWARETGLKSILCRVFPENRDDEDLLLLRVEGKLFGPPLNAAEKAQIIAKFSSAMPHQFVFDQLLPALGIPPRDEAVAKWRGLSQAGEKLLHAVASGAIAERAALELSTWGEEGAEILAMLEELRCSASIQMEIVERIREIALRENHQRSAVLRQPELQTILKEPRLNHRQKTEALRALLTRWRFPRLSAREARFVREWSAASLPQAIRMAPPPAFEGEHWQLQVTFASSQELKDLLEKAVNLANSPLLESVLSSDGSGERPPSFATKSTKDTK